MYNLYGVELDLNSEILKKYSELALADVGSNEFNRTLEWLAKMMLKTETFEKAVDLYGAAIVAKKIAAAMEEELNTFAMEMV